MQQRKVLNSGYVRLETQVTGSPVFTFHVKSPLFLFNRFTDKHLGTFKRVHSAHFEFYTPSHFQDQSGAFLPNETCNILYTKYQNFHIWLYNFYRKLLETNIHPQQTEMMLPQSLFVEYSWRVNIVDFQKFLEFYKGETSYEVQQYIQSMIDLMADQAPWTSEFLK